MFWHFFQWLELKRAQKQAVKDAQKEAMKNYRAQRPLVWWIDDLSHRVCGLFDHPLYGLDRLPWPDCDKVYLAIDKTAYDELQVAHDQLKYAIRETQKTVQGCTNHKASTYNGQASWCTDCGKIYLIEDMVKELLDKENENGKSDTTKN